MIGTHTSAYWPTTAHAIAVTGMAGMNARPAIVNTDNRRRIRPISNKADLLVEAIDSRTGNELEAPSVLPGEISHVQTLARQAYSIPSAAGCERLSYKGRPHPSPTKKHVTDSTTSNSYTLMSGLPGMSVSGIDSASMIPLISKPQCFTPGPPRWA